jgi:Tol biopolymer transport system component/tRNA A-37 threonylcarbamoyl transferase component Bud32
MPASDVLNRLQQSLGAVYTVERELGAGGMARVFVADEVALGRRVVVKVLRPELGEGISSARFEREVRLAARLQHPHIVPLLAAGALANGALYYTMPFVEGESLRERLAREGALPVEDVVRLGRDIAAALAYAHTLGIVHRDIKPENVLLSHGGAMVADFGIAKAISAARDTLRGDGEQESPSTLTAAGISVGTPAYMAPEQAAGGVVDHRADLYALGVVLYEMLAGRPPFEGRTPQRLLAAHATEAPEPIERRRTSVPPALANAVTMLLLKEPADRPQTAEDVLRLLDERAATWQLTTGRARRPGWRARIADPLIATSLMVALGAAIVMVWSLRSGGRSTGEVPHARLTLDLPADARLSPTLYGHSMAFSPDGSTLVYVGGAPVPRLYVRRLDEDVPHPLAGTEGAMHPTYSPDGRWIAFNSRGVLRRVPAEGGIVTTLATGVTTFALGPDGTIVLSRPVVEGLWYLSATGTVERITGADSVLGGIHALPAFLPDGKTVLFTATSASGAPTVGAVRLGDHAMIPLGIPGSNPLYLPGGYLVTSQPDGSLTAVRLDESHLRAVGERVAVLDHVAMKVLGSAELALAPNGALAYLPGPIEREVVLMDRGGNARTLLPSPQFYSQPRASPDGRRVAVAVGPAPYGTDIWIYDISSRTFTRLTTTGSNDRAEWTRDGRRVTWTSNVSLAQTRAGNHRGIWWQPWDASQPAELVISNLSGGKFAPGQDFLVASTMTGPAAETRLYRAPFASAAPGVLIAPAARVFRQFRLSPDGKWLAYISDETGISEIYVQPVPGPGGHFQISNGGGTEPVWNPTGHELFYRNGPAMIAATLAESPERTVVRRDTLFTTNAVLGVIEAAYDVMPDGQHFLMLTPASVMPSPRVILGSGR